MNLSEISNNLDVLRAGLESLHTELDLLSRLKEYEELKRVANLLDEDNDVIDDLDENEDVDSDDDDVDEPRYLDKRRFNVDKFESKRMTEKVDKEVRK